MQKGALEDEEGITVAEGNQMAFRGCLHLHLLIFVVLSVAVAAAGVGAKGGDAPSSAVPGIGVDLATACPPIDACRGGVANEQCCKAVAAALVAQGSCSCVCKVLKGYPRLQPSTAACPKKWCSTCDQCACR